MNISTVAGFLINHAVKTAGGLSQNSKENASQMVLKPTRDKPSERLSENSRSSMRSSAYRVTISSAAMQKMSTSGMAT